MRTAVLDLTRQFFKLNGNPSVVAALRPMQFWGDSFRSDTRTASQRVSRLPRRKMALLASAFLGPAVLGIVYEPWKSASANEMTEPVPVVKPGDEFVGRIRIHVAQSSRQQEVARRQ